MTSRRTVLRTGLAAATLSIGGCVELRVGGADDDRPGECPIHSEATDGWCGTTEEGPAEISSLHDGDSGENEISIRLQPTDPVWVDPAAYAFFRSRRGEWHARAVIDPDPENRIVAPPDSSIEWRFSFDEMDSSTSGDRPYLIGLAPAGPGRWNALAVPVWHEDTLYSCAMTFPRSAVRSPDG